MVGIADGVRVPVAAQGQWRPTWIEIGGADAATYTLVAADVGSTIRVVVTATNAGGSTSAASAATAPVAAAIPPSNITPPAIVGNAGGRRAAERDDRHVDRLAQLLWLPMAAIRG